MGMEELEGQAQIEQSIRTRTEEGWEEETVHLKPDPISMRHFH